jgi:ribose/xylose/arabinose/galactoside ABC-type transport system permease subunit
MPRRLSELAAPYGVWIVLIVVAAGLSIVSDAFLGVDNLLNLVRQSAILGLVAVGLTFVFVGGAFDLSVGATVMLAAVVAIRTGPTSTTAALAAVLAASVAGAAVGLVNGVLVGRFGANSFIVTVGMQGVILGATLLYTGGRHVWTFEVAPLFAALGEGWVAGLPMPVVVFLVGAALGHVLLAGTVFGRAVRHVGTNVLAAHLSGLPVAAVRAGTFALAGLYAGVAGVLLAARVRNVDPSKGTGLEFDAITALVLGGTSLFGGRGSVTQTVGGVLLLGLLANGMVLLGFPASLQYVVKGVLLLGAATFDVVQGRASRA